MPDALNLILCDECVNKYFDLFQFLQKKLCEQFTLLKSHWVVPVTINFNSGKVTKISTFICIVETPGENAQRRDEGPKIDLIANQRWPRPANALHQLVHSPSTITCKLPP